MVEIVIYDKHIPLQLPKPTDDITTIFSQGASKINKCGSLNHR